MKRHVFIVGGLATSPDYFTGLSKEIYHSFAKKGIIIEVTTLFPYGDWSAAKWKQVYEIRADLRLPHHQIVQSRGGVRTKDAIIAQCADINAEVLIIGHSGGGIAGYHAARLLEGQTKINISFIVQVGSPKVKIKQEYQHKVGYIRGLGKRMFDPITYYGRWGKIGKPFNEAPLFRENVSLIGGHPDYFRESYPFVDREGISNLTKTLDIMLTWIRQ
jgi:hypothetical protein